MGSHNTTTKSGGEVFEADVGKSVTVVAGNSTPVRTVAQLRISASLRAPCLQCGDVELPVDQAACYISDSDCDNGLILFKCPACEGEIEIVCIIEQVELVEYLGATVFHLGED